jgi:hypothetical protein
LKSGANLAFNKADSLLAGGPAGPKKKKKPKTILRNPLTEAEPEAEAEPELTEAQWLAMLLRRLGAAHGVWLGKAEARLAMVAAFSHERLGLDSPMAWLCEGAVWDIVGARLLELQKARASKQIEELLMK